MVVKANKVPFFQKQCWKGKKIICVGILLFLSVSDSFPINGNWEKYLTQFGYLPSYDSSESAPLRTETQMRDAIKNLQFFAGLPSDGNLNQETEKLLRRPRCGVPDVASTGYRNKRYNIQGQRWQKLHITWNLKKPHKSFDSEILIKKELSKALRVWSQSTLLNFQELSSEEEADIEVYFYSQSHGDGYPFDGLGSVLAHAFFPGSGRGGDAHFDDDEIWTQGSYEESGANGDKTSLYAVAVHEFGHSLGLSHSPVKNSLMFPWYSSSLSQNSLPLDDLLAIQILYQKSNVTDFPSSSSSPSLPRLPKQSGFPNSNPSSQNNSQKINVCNTGFDAVSLIRGEMWAFKNRVFWRINKDKEYKSVSIASFWFALPKNISHIDAVYERSDHKIVFFIGRFYYILSGNSQIDEGPLSLSSLGLPKSLNRIDGVNRWGWNGQTYLFSGSVYWKLDEKSGKVELDYPRDISAVWHGIPNSIDSVFTYGNGKTYFFKGEYFWELSDLHMRVVSDRPSSIGEYWFNCPKEIKNPFDRQLGSSSVSLSFKRNLFYSLISLSILLFSLESSLSTLLLF